MKMFKSKRKIHKSCRDTRRIGNNVGSKRAKVEGNSNVAAHRMSVPPGFLSGGIRSKLVRKSKNNYKETRQFQQKILDEDLQGLLFHEESDSSDDNKQLRRSLRLSRKKHKTENIKVKSAADYYQDTNSPGSISPAYKTPSNKKRTILKSNSKSLFREINERCLKSNISNKKDVINCHRQDNIESPKSDINNFNSDLITEANLSLATKTLQQIGVKIYKEILKVNSILSGKENPDKEMTPSLRKEISETEEKIDFVFIPPQEWIYKTPPRQKIVVPKVDNCQIQPAILCSSKKQQNIYELKSSLINVDFSRYKSRQEVDVDSRYLKHVASINVPCEIKAGRDNQNCKFWGFKNDCVDLTDDPFLKPQFIEPVSEEISNHFQSLTCRPSKNTAKRSRIGTLKKNNIFHTGGGHLEPQPGCSSSAMEMDDLDDFTFIKDDEGEMNLMPGKDSKKFKFAFQMNGCDDRSDGNLFKFVESPGMFNFSGKNN